MPKYLEPIDTKTRNEIITVCSKATTEISRCVIVGGVALRLLYEVKTGKPMFGTGKGDYDIYVPTSEVKEIEQKPPLGYRINQEPRFHKPEQGYIVLIDEQNNNAHIDVFGRDDREFEDLVIDGKNIRVLSLGEQTADRLRLFVEDFKKLKPDDQNKHKFYMKKLQEIIELSGDNESISHAWARVIERRKAELTGLLEESNSLAESVGATFEEFARKSVSVEAVKQNADQTAVELAEEIKKIPVGDEKFEEKAKEVYLSVRMKGYSPEWKSLLDQITGS